jgi:hypothetical protein
MAKVKSLFDAKRVTVGGAGKKGVAERIAKAAGFEAYPRSLVMAPGARRASWS